jgi:hypothetical protein
MTAIGRMRALRALLGADTYAEIRHAVLNHRKVLLDPGIDGTLFHMQDDLHAHDRRADVARLALLRGLLDKCRTSGVEEAFAEGPAARGPGG